MLPDLSHYLYLCENKTYGVAVTNLNQLFADHISLLQKQYSEIMNRLSVNQIVVHSGMLDYKFLDDMPFPFKVNPHFNYWVPVTDNPNCFLILKAGAKPQLLYFQAADYWHEVAKDPEGFWTNQFDIKMITSLETAKSLLSNSVSQSVYIGAYGNLFSQWGFKSVNPENLMNEIHYLRAVKTPYEQYCMREASKIGARGHHAAKKAFYEGASEFEIHIEYLRAAGLMEQHLPYGNIIGLNEHGSTLHYMNVEHKRKAELFSFLIDAGGQYNGYASDITRTYSYNKNDEFSELIAAMDREQLGLIEKLKVGEPYPETHFRSHQSVAKLLHDFKFVDLSPDAIVEKKISSTFLPHGIGHLLGMQVHDIAGFQESASGGFIPRPDGHPYLRLTRTIQEGFVFTIEPGLYFIPMLLDELKKSENSKYINWAKVESFLKYGGIRIEDNILITKTGTENFTRDAFKAIG